MKQPNGPQPQAASTLPPLPPGVAELSFRDFFVYPVGDRGLKLTEKLLGLHGKRVRILGFMARRETPVPGIFLLTPLPAHEGHDTCLIDDLPPGTVHVFTATRRDAPVPFTPKLMLLTGTLSVGNRAEPSGGVSMVRLELEPPEPAAKRRPPPSGKGAERLMSAAHP